MKYKIKKQYWSKIIDLYEVCDTEIFAEVCKKAKSYKKADILLICELYNDQHYEKYGEYLIY